METKVIKFKKLKEQDEGAEFDLDSTLILYWHLVPDISSGDYTSCGQAITEYLYDEKEGKITCPECLKVISFYKKLLKQEDGNSSQP